ncbi:hypothetical protein NHQ30_005852 [Ciborinia camelliae]|nr:hypothetical protein NHQ30_005852 [Ciborinia camelliae]
MSSTLSNRLQGSSKHPSACKKCILGGLEILPPTSSIIPTSRAFEEENTRTMELKLMYHYSTSTSILLSHNPQDLILNHVVTRLALSNPFLLDAIFTAAAIHLSIVETDKSDFWIDTAFQYHTRTIAGFDEALHNSASSDLNAVIACGTILTLNSYSLSSKRLRVVEVDAVAKFVETLKQLRGISLRLHQAAPGVYKGSFHTWATQQVAESLNTNRGAFAALITHIDSTKSVTGQWGLLFGQYFSSKEDQSKIAKFYQTILLRMAELVNYVNGPELEHRDQYQKSYQLLLKFTTSLGQGDDIVMSWPTMIDEHMILLLEAGDDVAMLILVHYGVLLYMYTLRFSKGTGRCLVQTLSMSLWKKHPEWAPVLGWAIESVLQDM